MSSRDRFWAGTQLAFHAYSNGLLIPELERTRRGDDDDGNGNGEGDNEEPDDKEDNGNNNYGDDDIKIQDKIANARGSGLAKSQREGEDLDHGTERGGSADAASPANQRERRRTSGRGPDGGAARLILYTETAPSLRQLGSTIDAIFNLNAIDSIAYALAAGEPKPRSRHSSTQGQTRGRAKE
ncbi:hypothetical protein GGI42DRAFT_358950 [Trichoderma sp. SZMC 28013]